MGPSLAPTDRTAVRHQLRWRRAARPREPTPPRQVRTARSNATSAPPTPPEAIFAHASSCPPHPLRLQAEWLADRKRLKQRPLQQASNCSPALAEVDAARDDWVEDHLASTGEDGRPPLRFPVVGGDPARSAIIALVESVAAQPGEDPI